MQDSLSVAQLDNDSFNNYAFIALEINNVSIHLVRLVNYLLIAYSFGRYAQNVIR